MSFDESIYWYGKKTSKDTTDTWYIFLFIVSLVSFMFSFIMFDPDSGFDHYTHTPTFAEVDGNCFMMKQWLEINPNAWHQDEKILRYNFICGDK